MYLCHKERREHDVHIKGMYQCNTKTVECAFNLAIHNGEIERWGKR
jgi:hypothetical protein